MTTLYNPPYDECETCKELGDCPHPDVQEDMMGTPMPPDSCPKPIDIMNATVKKHKLRKPNNKKDARDSK
jgi:hypothetical protein